MKPSVLILSLMACCPTLTSPAWCGSCPDGTIAVVDGGTQEVAREADVNAQYAAAGRAEKAIRGTKGAERRVAQARAAAAFEAVARYFPKDTKWAGRALYRAAALYERLRDRENGVRCLKQVMDMPAETTTLAKAHVLMGHIYRRARNFPDAVREYRAVVERFSRANAQVLAALEWLGKCKARLGDHQGAREAWQARIERAADRPKLVIASTDLIACSLFREGKVAEARAVHDACLKQFATAAESGGREGQRVRAALAKMRIVKLLESGAKQPATPPRGETP